MTAFSVAAYGTRMQVVAGAAVAFGAALGESALAGSDDWPFAATLIAFALAAGLAVRGPLNRTRWLAHRAQAAEAEAAAATARERARLARDLHDIVSHGVSVMVVQAAAAEQLREDPARAATSLRAVQATGRETMSELQRLLGVLRAEGDDDLAPQPSLTQVDALMDAVRAAGVDVAFEVRGVRRRHPASVESSAFGVVQEALTNVRAARARRRGPRRPRVGAAADIEVSDDGAECRPAVAGPGHGLIGMRERVGLLGGTLERGPRPEGGFRVQRQLPLDGERAHDPAC